MLQKLAKEIGSGHRTNTPAQGPLNLQKLFLFGRCIAIYERLCL